jgi:GTPase
LFLKNGNGEAFYEIGVHDDGKPVGILKEQIFETMLVLFHIAEKIGATLHFVKARLGFDYDHYSL